MERQPQQRNDIGGRKRRRTPRRDGGTTAPAPTPQAATTQIQKQNIQINETSTNIKIYKSTIKVELFPTKKNRRLTPRELQWEKEDAKAWKRPMRTFLYDKPIYPWLPITPKTIQPNVCFDLGFTE